jgi:hypothetical protein
MVAPARALTGGRSCGEDHSRGPAGAPLCEAGTGSGLVEMRAHSFLATSGPVMRASSGKVAAMMPRDTTMPATMRR